MDEQAIHFRSEALANERTVWVVPPANPAACDSAVVFLDGEFYRGRVGAPIALGELRGKHRLRDLWVVYVSHRSADDRWVECPCNPAFAEAIAAGLPAFLRVHFPAFAKVRHTVLVGLSYTGLAAAYIALMFPGAFQDLICQSGSFWWNDQWLVREYKRAGDKVSARFFLDVGTRETQRGLQHRPDVFQAISQREAVFAFQQVLIRLGKPVECLEFEGGHGMTGWAVTLPKFLERTLGCSR